MARVEESYEAHTKKMNAYGAITSAEIHYLVFEAADEEEALRAVLEIAPKVHGVALLDSVEIDERCNETTFKVNATYETEQGNNSDSGDDDPEPEMSFDCGGGTMHVTRAIYQEHRKGDRDAGGLIGWNGQTGENFEVTGVDVPTAQLRETYTRIMSSSRITAAYKKTVAGLVGKVNSNKFKGWDAGEVMFLGMSYSAPQKGSEKITVTYNFAIQLNEKQKIADVTINKQGFDYVWTMTHTEANEKNAPSVVIDGIYCARVCQRANFSALGI